MRDSVAVAFMRYQLTKWNISRADSNRECLNMKKKNKQDRKNKRGHIANGIINKYRYTPY